MDTAAEEGYENDTMEEKLLVTADYSWKFCSHSEIGQTLLQQNRTNITSTAANATPNWVDNTAELDMK